MNVNGYLSFLYKVLIEYFDLSFKFVESFGYSYNFKISYDKETMEYNLQFSFVCNGLNYDNNTKDFIISKSKLSDISPFKLFDFDRVKFVIDWISDDLKHLTQEVKNAK